MSLLTFSQGLKPEIIGNKLCFDTLQANIIKNSFENNERYRGKIRGYDSLIVKQDSLLSIRDSLLTIQEQKTDSCMQIIANSEQINGNNETIIKEQDKKIRSHKMREAGLSVTLIIIIIISLI